MVHRGKSQVYGHLNVLENESNRGGRHVTVAVVSRESRSEVLASPMTS